MHKLGIIIPSSNTTVEPEFSSTLYGSKISLHTARIRLNDVTVDGLLAMEKETETATQLLKDADVDVIVFACTSGSLIRRTGHDKEVAEKISRIAKRPAVVTSGAVVDGLRKLSVRRVALATPYIDEINIREVEFLTQNGFEVINVQTLNLKENLKIGRLTADDAAALARKADSACTDAVFVSCTNFATFNTIPTLEAQLKKPVISSNSATLWAALKALRLKLTVPLGKLFGV